MAVRQNGPAPESKMRVKAVPARDFHHRTGPARSLDHRHCSRAVVAGLVAAISLPVGLFPQVSFPRVVVDLSSGDRPVDQTV